MTPIVLQVKEASLYAERVDWKEVNTKFIELTKESEDLQKGLQYLINSLGDKHATIRSTKNHAIVVSYTGEVEGEDIRESEFINTVINDVSATFSYKLLDNGIGYLRVVGIGGGVVKEQAEFIRNGLVELKKEGVSKWIVDVRYNGGGNIEPMIAGLSPLIGEGFVGGAINKRNEIRDYKIENGQSCNYERLICEMDNLTDFDTNEKVAVLLSR